MTTKIRVFFYSSDFSVCCGLPIVGLSFQFAWETLPPLYSMVLLEKPNIGRVIRGGSHTFECITNYSLCFFTQNYTTHEYTSIQILFVWHLQKKWKKNNKWFVDNTAVGEADRLSQLDRFSSKNHRPPHNINSMPSSSVVPVHRSASVIPCRTLINANARQTHVTNTVDSRHTIWVATNTIEQK